jgi:hypothetical protein
LSRLPWPFVDKGNLREHFMAILLDVMAGPDDSTCESWRLISRRLIPFVFRFRLDFIPLHYISTKRLDAVSTKIEF